MSKSIDVLSKSSGLVTAMRGRTRLCECAGSVRMRRLGANAQARPGHYSSK